CTNRTQRRGSGDLIVGDVVDLELASVDVAQDQVGRPGGSDGSDARELPFQTNLAQEGRASDLIVRDVVDLQPTVLAVAQQEIGLAGNAAEIADARELPMGPHRAYEGSVGI